MSRTLPTTQGQAIHALLARYRRELREYDARPQQYKPHWQLTAIGEALLLHRAVERMNPRRPVPPIVVVDADVDDADAGDAGVGEDGDGGDA